MEISLYKKFYSKSSPFTLGVDFTLPQNGTSVLFGASGSGKTLTLQCLAGLMTPDSGRIVMHNGRTLYNNKASINIPARQRRIGYMVQEYALFPHLTVLQNVAYGISAFLPWCIGAKQKESAMNLLQMLGIEKLADQLPKQISGGQRQRVALARALCITPDLLLLDEPFSALDPLLRRRLRKELHEELEQLGIPSIIISHDPEDVAEFADTLVLYKNGSARVWDSFSRHNIPAHAIGDMLIEAQAKFIATH